MENHPVEKKTSLNPKFPRLLGDIPIDPAIKQPLGGINPYSPHFESIGSEFKRIITETCGYNTNSKITDIGCGTGRLAKQIKGNYIGVEINNKYYSYCKAKYKSHRFIYLDYRHEEYNIQGKSIEYSLPIEDSSQHLVTLIAVLNHNYESDIVKIIREASRILTHKGKLFITSFLINQHSSNYIKSIKNPPYSFKHQIGLQLSDYYKRPLFNISIAEDHLRRELISNNLMVIEPILYGSWSGVQNGVTGHDIIIAQKE